MVAASALCHILLVRLAENTPRRRPVFPEGFIHVGNHQDGCRRRRPGPPRNETRASYFTLSIQSGLFISQPHRYVFRQKRAFAATDGDLTKWKNATRPKAASAPRERVDKWSTVPAPPRGDHRHAPARDTAARRSVS